MGVSADSGNLDLSAAIGGGSGFAQRLQELQTATAAYNKALEDLNLGKAARAAHDEAGRILSAAKAQRDADMAALDAEVSNARNSMNVWVEQTKAKIMADYHETQAALVDARSKHEAAASAEALAQLTSTKAKAEAATLIKDAEAQANEIIQAAQQEAAKIEAKAKIAETLARKALAEAQASKDRYDAAMERIKSAVA